MAILFDLGLNRMAKAAGLKRKFLGCESDKSLARRVVLEMGKQNPIVSFLENLEKAFAPRVCIREERFEIQGEQISPGVPRKLGHGWIFHYSDGTEETVTVNVINKQGKDDNG